MNIVQVCHRYHPYVGGIERIVKNIAEHLAKMKDHVTVYATDTSIKRTSTQCVEGVKLRNYPAFAPKEAYYIPHFSMLLDLAAENMDILHAFNIHAITTVLAYCGHKLNTAPPFVISPFYHGKGHTKLAQLLWVPYLPFVKKIIQNTDGIIVNSTTQKVLVRNTLGHASKIFTVYDGVDVATIKNAEPFTVADNQKILLYVGRLEKYKNVHVAITSLKHLPPNYHLYIIGRGSFRSSLEKVAHSHNLTGRVHFLGFQPDHTVHRWMKTAHIFLHLSEVESFGMTCLESLAAGTPVIANHDGYGLSETIALFPHDIVAFRVNKEPVSALAQLILDATTLKPIRVDVSQFSWKVVTEGMRNIYAQILEN